MEDWLTSLSSINPVLKLKIDKVEDLQRVKNAEGGYDSVPNPRTANPDGTAAYKNVVDWKAGVQPA